MNSIKNKGFTLIEILVALAILGIVLAGIYSVYRMQHKSYIVQEQVTEMQQNERVALQIITRDMRMAGLGLSQSPTLGITFNEDINHNGILDAGEDVNGNGLINVYDGAGYDESDVITITHYSFNPDSRNGGKTQISENTGGIGASAELPVYSTDGFAEGDLILVYSAFDFMNPDSDLNHYAIICITNVQTEARRLQHNPGQGSSSCADKKNFENRPSGIGSGFRAGDWVKKINRDGGGGSITYAINNSYQLTRSIDGGNAQPVADNIEDLQIAYGIDANNDGIVGIAEWYDDPTGQDINRLRDIRISLVARTTREDPEWNIGVRPVVENHDPSTSIITTPAQAAAYRRRVLQSTIRLRDIDGTKASF